MRSLFLSACLLASFPVSAGLTTVKFDEFYDNPYYVSPQDRLDIYGDPGHALWDIREPVYSEDGVTLTQLFGDPTRNVGTGVALDVMNILDLAPGHGNGLLLASSPLSITSSEQIYLEAVQLLRFDIDGTTHLRVDAYQGGALTGTATVDLQPGASPVRFFDDFSFSNLGPADRFVLTGIGVPGSQSFWIDNLAVRGVPEPGSFALAASAMLLGFFGLRRRRPQSRSIQ